MKNKVPQNKPSLKQTLGKFNVRLALTLSGLVIAALALFKLLKNLDLYLFAVILYTAATLAVALWYIIYNKGNVSGKVTPDMLPPEWDTARKQAFLDDLATRRKKSKWALLVLIPMIAVFGFEMLELYVVPPLGAILASLGFTVGV